MAWLFRRARLTRVQADVAKLAARKYTYGEIAGCLGLSYTACRNAARKAEGKLIEAHPWLISRLTREIKVLLDCMRNVRDTRPARVLLYRERSFGWERDPVTLRPRPEGECPEDLATEPGRILASLPALLRRTRDEE